MSLDEFLAWEREQEFRWEFDGIAPVAMTGGTIGHRQFADQLTAALNARLGGRGCRAYADDVKVIVAGRVRYPDVVVTCVPVDLSSDIVPEPLVVVEILSPSTERTDRFLKLEEYRRTAPIEHFLLVEPTSRNVMCFTRNGDQWMAHAVSGRDAVDLPALGVSIPLDEIYGDFESGPEATTER